MVAMAKIFEELFIPTLNGIAVSVWYVSSTPVILHTVLNDQLQRIKKHYAIKSEENRKQRRVFLK